MKKSFPYALGLGLLLLVFLFFKTSSALQYSKNPDSLETVYFSVRQGQGASQVAKALKEEGWIQNPTVFLAYLKLRGLDSQLKAGRIPFQENFTLSEIADALVEGKNRELSITLLEGWTAQEMGQALEKAGLTTESAFMDCVKTCSFKEFKWLPEGALEGYLFPDTYFVNPGNYSNEAFIARLLSTFESKFGSEFKAIASSKRTLEEIVIMASIVEREERAAKERPTIAGILWNRFEAGMMLGADATVLYGLGRTKGALTYEDLQSKSPYNTRKFAGLPPTPISNPSLSSLKAALYPQKTGYWYYLHDNEGQVHYAATLDQHNVNKANYLR